MMKFLLLALLPALIYGAPSSRIVNHHVCQYSHGAATRPPAPAWVTVEGCAGATCNVPNGRATLIEAAFAPTTSHTALFFRVRVFLIGIEIQIEQPDGLDNACPMIEGGCPVTAGQGETVARLNFQQESPLAGLSVRIEVDLVDTPTGVSVVCGGVQVSVVAP